MILTLLFIGGLALVVAGIALVFVPAALVVAGLTLCALAVLLHRGESRSPAAPAPDGGSD